MPVKRAAPLGGQGRDLERRALVAPPECPGDRDQVERKTDRGQKLFARIRKREPGPAAQGPPHLRPPGAEPRFVLTPATLGLPTARPGICECVKVLAASRNWNAAWGPRSPAARLVRQRAWTRPSIQKQEELTGGNVSSVSTPGRDLLPMMPGKYRSVAEFRPFECKM